MNPEMKQALLEWLKSQFDVATEMGGNTIDLGPGEEVHVENADIVDGDLLVMFTNGESAAFTVEAV